MEIAFAAAYLVGPLVLGVVAGGAAAARVAPTQFPCTHRLLCKKCEEHDTAVLRCVFVPVLLTELLH